MTNKRPPGPNGTWLGGSLSEFKANRLAFLRRMADTYGDVVSFRLAHRRIYLVSHPDLIEQILVTNSRHFQKHFALRLNPLVLGNGLLTSEGKFWLKQRRLIQPAFLNASSARYAPDMLDATDRHLDQWKHDSEIDISAAMMSLTLSIAAKTLFGADPESGEHDEVREALHYLQENFLRRFSSLIQLPFWVPTPRNIQTRRVVRRLDRIIYRFIEKRSTGEPRDDLLSRLLHARDEDDGSRMSNKQLRDEAMTLFVAGHETPALALSWTWYLLAQHPEVVSRLVDEVDTVLGDRSPTADDVPRLTCTANIIRESMRLFSPAYVVGREALSDVEVGGYHVPRKTTMLMSQWVVHYDPRFWDEPNAFRPERWEQESEPRAKFAYFPFGGGPRVCIGKTFADLETVLVLARIAQRFRFELKDGQAIQPYATFTLRPSENIMGMVRSR